MVAEQTRMNGRNGEALDEEIVARFRRLLARARGEAITGQVVAEVNFNQGGISKKQLKMVLVEN
jgi:hypothetical protein